MDDSIEIIEVRPPNQNYKPPPEIEIIEESCEKAPSQILPGKPATRNTTTKSGSLKLGKKKPKINKILPKKTTPKKKALNPKLKKRKRSIAKSNLGKDLEVLVVKSCSNKSAGKKRKLSANVTNRKLAKVRKVDTAATGSIPNTQKLPHDDDVEIVFEWDAASVISERQGIPEWQVRSVINLFDQENTLPFIARYRKEKTGSLEVEKLREIQNTYSQLRNVKDKVAKVMKLTNELGKEHTNSLLKATTMNEVEHLAASLKCGSKRSHAEKAKALGLEKPAQTFLQKESYSTISKKNFTSLIDLSKDGLKSLDDIELGFQHILADIISKDPKVLAFIRVLIRDCNPMVECVPKKIPKTETKSLLPTPAAREKLKNYCNYKNLAFAMKPHQILAINRGEKQKVLNVKVIIPDGASMRFFHFCQQNFELFGQSNDYRNQILNMTIEDSWERLVKPYMLRQIRSQLTEAAEIASIEVFTSNLKRLLLIPPLRGKTVLAIDPGFTHGCKIAVTNAQGEKMQTTTIYPFGNNSKHWSKDNNAIKLQEIVKTYRCEHFAIGNGTACRQMEVYLTKLISGGCFSPFNVQYTIVNESGVSQYSVTPEAMAELPGLDPNHISAVSLARRLQDPLLEYVKVHPMHLGIGMYQHDLPEKLLHSSLESVMTECVSFVGVDINVASEFVVRKLSGLSKIKAAKVIEHRNKKGPFTNRQQLRDVKGIGPVTFEQCAGFVKIVPETLQQQIQRSSGTSKRDINCCELCPLDRTMIHPESYDAAKKFMKLVNVSAEDIGKEHFIKKICNYSKNSRLADMASTCNTTESTMQLIVEGLSLSLDFDMRAEFGQPLFRKGIMSIDDLKPSSKVTGTVRNVTDFGSFVDIGVEIDALIHITRTRGKRLELGSTVEAMILSVDKGRKRISMELLSIL